MKSPFLLLLLIGLVGCVTTPESRTYSVTEVGDNLLDWHGRKVFVNGYVVGCMEFPPCLLSDGPRVNGEEASLIVGHDPDFTEMLKKARGYRVLIEAEVNATCRMPDTICTGYPAELQPIRFIRAY